MLVTHDASLAARTQRTIRLRDGVVVEDIRHEPALVVADGAATNGAATNGAAAS